MRINYFKFNHINIEELTPQHIQKSCQIFGFDYLTELLLYIFDTYKIKTTKPDIIEKLTRRRSSLISLRISKQSLFWYTSIYLRFIDGAINNVLGVVKNEKVRNLLTSLLDVFNNPEIKYLSIFDIDKGQKIRDHYKYYAEQGIVLDSSQVLLKTDSPVLKFERTYKQASFDIDKITAILGKQLKFIYVKDNSKYDTNWYSFETHTRHSGNNKSMYVIPFYRKIDRESVTFRLVLELELPIESNSASFGSYPFSIENSYYPPKRYNNLTRKIAENIRLALQKKEPFSIKDNYTTIGDNYHLYNGKFIDIDFKWYKLNKKWLKEAEIIRACKKL